MYTVLIIMTCTLYTVQYKIYNTCKQIIIDIIRQDNDIQNQNMCNHYGN